MLQRNHLIQPADTAFLEEYGQRIDAAEHLELLGMLAVNLTGDDDEWFDEEMPTPEVSIIDEIEFFDRYFGDLEC